MMLEENPLVHTAAVQSAERVPSRLQSPTYWELHVPYRMSRLFLSCRSWSTFGRLMAFFMPTPLFSVSVWLVRTVYWCVVYTDSLRPVLYATDVLNIAVMAA